MDFKKVGIGFLVLGLIIVFAGIFQLSTNQPKRIYSSVSRYSYSDKYSSEFPSEYSPYLDVLLLF